MTTGIMIAMLEFSCPNCRARLGLDDRFAGKRARCPSCAQTIAAPSAVPPAAPVAAAAHLSGPAPLSPGELRRNLSDAARHRLDILKQEVLAGHPPLEAGKRAFDDIRRWVVKLARDQEEIFRARLKAGADTEDLVRRRTEEIKTEVQNFIQAQEEVIRKQVEVKKQDVGKKARTTVTGCLNCLGCSVVVILALAAFAWEKTSARTRHQFQKDFEEWRGSHEPAGSPEEEHGPGDPSVTLPQRSGPLEKEDLAILSELMSRVGSHSSTMRLDAVNRLRTLSKRDPPVVRKALVEYLAGIDEETAVVTGGALLLDEFGEEGLEEFVKLSRDSGELLMRTNLLIRAATSQRDGSRVARTLQQMEEATRGMRGHDTIQKALEDWE